VDVVATFVTDTEAPMLVKPAIAAFHDPAMHSQSAAMFRVSFGQHRGDPTPTEFSPMRFRVVSSVPLHAFRTGTSRARLASDSRNGVDQRQKLGHVVGVRPGERRRQRDALGIGQEMMFRAGLAAIRGIGARFFPPCTARTEVESTMPRDQSIWSAWRSLPKRTVWTRSQTPFLCQSQSRRQQVIPDPHPISLGRYSQGMPVFSTKRIPVRTSRLPRGLRPGCFRRRGFGGGKSGSINSHNASSRIGFAMVVPPCTAT